MEFIKHLADIDLAGNTLLDWSEALLAFVVAMAGLWLFQVVVLRRIEKIAARHHLIWPGYALSALDSTKPILLFVMAASLAAHFITIPPTARTAVSNLGIIAFFVQIGIWITAFYIAWYGDYRQRYLTQNAAVVTTLDATRVLVRLMIWGVILLLALNNLGFNITTLITGLGVGGIAVALAVQKILGDILASLAIVTDKPFVVGDFITLDAYMGNVEYIGLKTTRVRGMDGEQIIFSNSDLLSGRIRNFGRMAERRIAVTLGVSPDTPADKLRMVPGIIRDAIEAQKAVSFERAHFKQIGGTLDFEYVYYLQSSDYHAYMDAQQAINFAIFQRLGAEAIRPVTATAPIAPLAAATLNPAIVDNT